MSSDRIIADAIKVAQDFLRQNLPPTPSLTDTADGYASTRARPVTLYSIGIGAQQRHASRICVARGGARAAHDLNRTGGRCHGDAPVRRIRAAERGARGANCAGEVARARYALRAAARRRARASCFRFCQDHMRGRVRHRARSGFRRRERRLFHRSVRGAAQAGQTGHRSRRSGSRIRGLTCSCSPAFSSASSPW
jgi:hypothetical protein